MQTDMLYRSTTGGLMERYPISLRDATSADLEALSALCRRSKAVWGYDDAFLDACADELTVSYEDLLSSEVKIAQQGDTIVGVGRIELDGDQADLAALFVDPDWLNCGAGRILFEWARATARGRGARMMTIDSDPNAEGFYVNMGAKRVGLAPSHSIPGRMLPSLELTL